MFYGVNSSVVDTTCGALLDAMVEAALKAKNHGFQFVLFLGTSRQLVNLIQHRKTTNRLQQIRLADLDFLNYNGFCCDVLLVPKLVVKSVWSVANLACQMPLNCSWFNPAVVYSVGCFSPLCGIKKKEC